MIHKKQNNRFTSISVLAIVELNNDKLVLKIEMESYILPESEALNKEVVTNQNHCICIE